MEDDSVFVAPWETHQHLASWLQDAPETEEKYQLCLTFPGLNGEPNTKQSRSTHHALAMATRSPQGWRPSPYRPSPECSRELNVTMASKGRSSPLK